MHHPLAEAQSQAGTSMLCGTVRFRYRGSDHLLAALSPVLVIEHAQAEAWLAPLRQRLLEESLRSDTPSNAILSCLLTRLSQALRSKCRAGAARTLSVSPLVFFYML